MSVMQAERTLSKCIATSQFDPDYARSRRGNVEYVGERYSMPFLTTLGFDFRQPHGVQLPFGQSIIHHLAEPDLIEAHPMSAVGDVPCGPCRACCRHDLIPLMPERGDQIWTYEHEVVATPSGPAAVLRCAKDGSCVYLSPGGCTIHDRAPAACRAFDCRGLFNSKTSTELRAMVKSGAASKEVLSAGRERLRTLDRL